MSTAHPAPMPATGPSHQVAGVTPTPAPRLRRSRRTPFWAAVGTVAAREMRVKAASKAFVITTLIVIAAALAATLLAPRLGELLAGDATRVAAVEQTAPAVGALGEGYETRTVGDVAAARAAVESGEVSAAVVPDPQSPSGLGVLAMTDVPTDLVQALAATVPGMRGVYGGRLRNAHQVEALTANLISVNRRYKAHAGLRVTDV